MKIIRIQIKLGGQPCPTIELIPPRSGSLGISPTALHVQAEIQRLWDLWIGSSELFAFGGAHLNITNSSRPMFAEAFEIWLIEEHGWRQLVPVLCAVNFGPREQARVRNGS